MLGQEVRVAEAPLHLHLKRSPGGAPCAVLLSLGLGAGQRAE